MKNFFKTKTTVKEQTTQQLVEEIHESFYTEVDKLLEYAKNPTPEPPKSSLLKKSERLTKLGFSQTKEVKLTEEEQSKTREIFWENYYKRELVEAINYFQFKYPNYKFITQDSVKKICKKYGLIYSEVENYIGEVPDKNLQEIEVFKIDKNDQYYIGELGYTMEREFGGRKRVVSFMWENRGGEHLHWNKCSPSPLEIAAPANLFNLQNMQIVDYKLTNLPDPIVLKPVVYKEEKYYLIVTAWGAEASDELVVNEKMN